MDPSHPRLSQEEIDKINESIVQVAKAWKEQLMADIGEQTEEED